MRRILPALSLTSLLAFAPACDSDDTVGEDFRAGLDIGISLSQAQGGDDDGTIIWEIVEAEVYDGPASDANLRLYINDNTIYDNEGQATCEVNSPFLNSNMREVIAANGSDVLFTVWGSFVFTGEVNVNSFPEFIALFKEQLLFQYRPYQIFNGRARNGDLLMTSSADLRDQSEGRKLLIAALITGDCGSAGLPGYAL